MAAPGPWAPCEMTSDDCSYRVNCRRTVPRITERLSRPLPHKGLRPRQGANQMGNHGDGGSASVVIEACLPIRATRRRSR
jgi:hypothetical protein